MEGESSDYGDSDEKSPEREAGYQETSSWNGESDLEGTRATKQEETAPQGGSQPFNGSQLPQRGLVAVQSCLGQSPQGIRNPFFDSLFPDLNTLEFWKLTGRTCESSIHAQEQASECNPPPKSQ